MIIENCSVIFISILTLTSLIIAILSLVTYKENNEKK